MSDSSDNIYIHSYPPSHSQEIKCASDVSKIASMEKKLNPSKNVIFMEVFCLDHKFRWVRITFKTLDDVDHV
ncbi:hypothetical protein MJO28_013936 [Puccinia striiformis f. sp. tritici]|uniref:Uncharacterized protein n=1 Tax=Puccinia striiformis f. sp. tritici TaxID=168172 RepID=A0ACC0DW57_9BASI|nr:hypothetical protein MJO28_013936 [Puccinia striiformis f. sp. tritici]